MDDGKGAALGVKGRVVPVQNSGHFLHGGRMAARPRDAARALREYHIEQDDDREQRPRPAQLPAARRATRDGLANIRNHAAHILFRKTRRLQSLSGYFTCMLRVQIKPADIAAYNGLHDNHVDRRPFSRIRRRHSVPACVGH